MKYELPSIELIVIEENDYLKFGEYLNDMQCDDTTNKLCLDDLEYVKKLQEENKGYITLVKCGVFFVALGKDAVILSERFGLNVKVTKNIENLSTDFLGATKEGKDKKKWLNIQ